MNTYYYSVQHKKRRKKMYEERVNLESFGAIATVPPTMALRSYKAYNDRDLRKEMIDKINLSGLQESLELSPTGEITSSLVAKHTDIDALKPSEYGVPIELPNGNNVYRLSFMLVVSVEKSTGTLFTYIQGYTDKYDVDRSYSALADDTRFYINKVTSILESIDMYGQKSYQTIHALEVVHNEHLGTIEYIDELEEIDTLSRGSDIMLDIAATSIGTRSQIQSYVNKIGNEGKITKGSQKNPNALLADLLNAWNLTVPGNGGPDINTHMSSVSLTKETSVTSVPFLRLLMSLRDEQPLSDTYAPHMFTYRELRTLFPEVEQMGTIIEQDEEAVTRRLEELRYYEEDSLARDSDTAVIVTMFINILLDKMSIAGIKSIGFTITNLTSMDGEIDIALLENAYPTFAIPGLDVNLRRKRLQYFLRSIKDEFFYQLTEHNQRGVLITVAIEEDFTGKVIIEGDNIVKGVYPINPAISSITSPLITTTKQFDHLSDSVNDLLINI